MLFYACFAEINGLFSPAGHFVSRKSLSLRQAASGALKMVATTAVWDKPDELNRLKNNLEGFVSRLRYIQSEMGMQKLDVHLLDYLPAWTLILINPTRSDAIAYVEMATYRAHPRKRPTFIVECSQDNPLFSLFRDEYEQMWKNAQPAWNQTLCGLR